MLNSVCMSNDLFSISKIDDVNMEYRFVLLFDETLVVVNLNVVYRVSKFKIASQQFHNTFTTISNSLKGARRGIYDSLHNLPLF